MLPFEIKYDGVDWATYGFKLAKEGIKNRDTLPPLRTNIEPVPGVDDPLDFGSDFGERHVYITGHIIGTTHSDCRTKIKNLRDKLESNISTYNYKQLIFGDDTSYVYQAVYDGTFTVRYIGSSLTSKIALVTVGFITKKDYGAVS